MNDGLSPAMPHAKPEFQTMCTFFPGKTSMSSGPRFRPPNPLEELSDLEMPDESDLLERSRWSRYRRGMLSRRLVIVIVLGLLVCGGVRGADQPQWGVAWNRNMISA